MANNSESYPLKQWVAFLYIAVAGKGGVKNYNMKKYIFLFVITLFVSACSSSKQFQQDQSLSFKLPRKANEIAFEDFFRQYNPKKSKINTNYYTNLFQMDSFYISTQPLYKRKILPDELSSFKKDLHDEQFFPETSIGVKNYESSIKIYGNAETLTEYLETDWFQASYFRFHVVDKAHSQLLVGVLQFPKTEKEKAAILLDKFYKSIRFTPADTSKNGL